MKTFDYLLFKEFRKLSSDLGLSPKEHIAIRKFLDKNLKSLISETLEKSKPTTYSRDKQYKTGFEDGTNQYHDNLRKEFEL